MIEADVTTALSVGQRAWMAAPPVPLQLNQSPPTRTAATPIRQPSAHSPDPASADQKAESIPSDDAIVAEPNRPTAAELLATPAPQLGRLKSLLDRAGPPDMLPFDPTDLPDLPDP